MNVQEYIATGILEAYVAGDVTDQERREVACLSSIYPEIKEALTQLEDDLEQLARSQAMNPPAGLKESIMAAIEAEKAKESPAPLKNVTDEPVPKPVAETVAETRESNTRWYYAAAAILIMGVLGYWGFVQTQRVSNLEQDLITLQSEKGEMEQSLIAAQQDVENTLALLADPNTKKLQLGGTDNFPNARLTVFWNAASGRTLVQPKDLPKPESGKQYQLWVLVDGQPIDMGVLPLDGDKLTEMKLAENADAFAITLEKEGGSPTPTLEQMVVIGNV